MESITIKVPVAIKAKLTEKMKDEMLKEDQAKIEQIEVQLERLDNEERKAVDDLEDGDIQKLQMIRQHFAQERQKGQAAKAKVEAHMSAGRKLSIGAEVNFGQAERIVELKVGDNVRDLFNAEVLVEDDKVIAIRG